MKHKGIAVLAPLALATVAALGFGQAAQAAPAVQGDTQLVTTDQWGDLQHTIRHADGSWQKMGLLKGIAGVQYLASANVDGEENVIVVTETGPSNNPDIQGKRLVRHTDGTWNLNAPLPQLPVMPEPVAAVSVNHKLNVLNLTPTGPEVAELGVDGTWSEFTNVPLGGHLRAIAAVANGNSLRVVGLAGDGATIKVIDRTATGWSPVTTTTVNVGEGNIATQLAAAQIGDTLEVSALVNSTTSPDAIPMIGFTAMDKSGTWSAFASPQAIIYGRPSQLSMTAANGETQLAYNTSDGTTYHTIRHADGTWQDAGSVTAVAHGDSAWGPITIAG
jgi:hypothetical protein